MKTIFYVITSHNRWGRGLTPKEAEKNASLTSASKIHYVLHIGIFKEETTGDELKSLQTFWGVNDYGELVRCSDLTNEDEKLISSKLVGWSVIEYNKPKVKKS
jgi:hypothetical protein